VLFSACLRACEGARSSLKEAVSVKEGVSVKEAVADRQRERRGRGTSVRIRIRKYHTHALKEAGSNDVTHMLFSACLRTCEGALSSLKEAVSLKEAGSNDVTHMLLKRQ
jgi:hypothetical protein